MLWLASVFLRPIARKEIVADEERAVNGSAPLTFLNALAAVPCLPSASAAAIPLSPSLCLYSVLHRPPPRKTPRLLRKLVTASEPRPRIGVPASLQKVTHRHGNR
jgi:hypothetical protein